MTVRFYSSTAKETTLSSSITNSATSITVGSVLGFPTSFPYTLAVAYETITEELVEVSAAAGTTLTVTRGIDGTSAAAQNAGARVRHVTSARDSADSRAHENTGSGVHGLGVGEVIVGTTSTQTLSNKTLSSPTVSGTIAGNTAFSGTWTGNAVAAAKIRLQNTTDVSPVSVDHAFQIGLDSGINIRMDGNEIMCVNNGVGQTMFIQPDGGSVSMLGNVGSDNLTNAILANGTIESNILAATRATTTGAALRIRTDADTADRLTSNASGVLNWGPGGSTAQDTNLFRAAADTLRTDDSLQVGTNLNVTGNATIGGTLGNILTTNVTTGGTTQTVDLNVTGSATLPLTSATGAAVATASSGWSMPTAIGTKIGGMTTLVFNFNRTGATITPETGPNTGNISPDSQLCTLTVPWRPTTAITQALIASASDGISHGAMRLNTDGTIDFVTWMPGILIASGDGNNYRCTFTFPSN